MTSNLAGPFADNLLLALQFHKQAADSQTEAGRHQLACSFFHCLFLNKGIDTVLNSYLSEIDHLDLKFQPLSKNKRKLAYRELYSDVVICRLPEMSLHRDVDGVDSAL